MRLAAVLGALLAFGVLGVLGVERIAGPGGATPTASAQAPLTCVVVRAQPWPAGYGWNHVVVVENHCQAEVRCEVATNVDPSPRYELVVPPGEERSVATRSGSPASAFRPIYTCERR
jgi:hypothetical protein